MNKNQVDATPAHLRNVCIVWTKKQNGHMSHMNKIFDTP